MKKLIGLSLAAAFLAGAPAIAEESGFSHLANLAGHCFEGVEEASGDQELRCYEWVFGDKFIREHLTVKVGDETYKGETLYSFDAGENHLDFTYWSSDGGVGEGSGTAVDNGIEYGEERFRTPDGHVMVLQQRLEVVSDTSFVFAMYQQAGEDWVALRRTVLTRTSR